MTTPAFAVNWWQVGWIVANNVIDRVVNLDGQSSNDQYSTYMVSPSIVFNNGTNGGEFYMRPQVSSRVTSFEMHAHRANPVDFGANIVLALSTTSGKRVINKTVGTNQYVAYTRSSSDGTGTWALDENNTSLFFLLDNEYIEWKFNENITNKYKKEDRINLHFKVITVKQYKGITFESIDFFKDSSNGINKQGPYPCISDYLK